ncbi:DUF3362 domain-containing protein [Escherichia coli]
MAETASVSASIRCRNFYPSPLANSTTRYYTGKNPLGKIGYKSEDVVIPKGDKQRRLHKALLRYHDPANWPLIRQALETMGKKHRSAAVETVWYRRRLLTKCAKRVVKTANTGPALTRHRPRLAHQRQTPATAKKASSTQSRPVNAGAKKRPKAAVGR